MSLSLDITASFSESDDSPVFLGRLVLFVEEVGDVVVEVDFLRPRRVGVAPVEGVSLVEDLLGGNLWHFRGLRVKIG